MRKNEKLLKREQLLKALEQKNNEKSLELAKHYLLLLNQKNDEDVKAIIEVKTLINQLYKNTYHQIEEDYYVEDLKNMLDQYQTDDDAFMIEHYELLYDQAGFKFDFIFAYDTLMKLVLLYRKTQNRQKLESTHNKVFALFLKMEENIRVAAKRLDGFELEPGLEPVAIHTDPIEQTSWFKQIEPNVHQQIYERIGRKRMMGYVHMFWNEKRTILEEQYGIVWASPRFLNDAMFD
jgi:hypothetical protein